MIEINVKKDKETNQKSILLHPNTRCVTKKGFKNGTT